MQENYFTLTFMIRKAQQKKSGEVPIFARITISGQRTEFNVNRSVDANNWNSAKGMAKGRSKKDMELNKYLDSIRVRMSEIHSKLIQEEEAINPLVLKNHYLGKIAGPKMLCEVFRSVVGQYKEKLACGDICNSTYLRWDRCVKYLSEFLMKRWKADHHCLDPWTAINGEWRNGTEIIYDGDGVNNTESLKNV